MKSRWISGVLFVLLGTLIAAGPWTLFPVCPAGEMTMNCFWTARAQIGVGVVIALIGLAALFISSDRARAGLYISLIPQGALVILLPTALIGVCENAHMSCRAAALPALVILGALVSAAAAVFLILVVIRFKKEKTPQ